MQGRITDLHMKEDGLELTGLVSKIGSTSLKRSSAKRNVAVCAVNSEKNSDCDNTDSGFSFPMSDMKRIATHTMMETKTVEIQIPGTAEKLDRVNLVRNRSRSMLKETL